MIIGGQYQGGGAKNKYSPNILTIVGRIFERFI